MRSLALKNSSPRAALTPPQTKTRLPDSVPAPPPHPSQALPQPPAAAASRRVPWQAVVKPPIYTVALIPVLVGFAAAFLDTGSVSAGRMVAQLLCSCLVIAWLNLSNDAWVRAAPPQGL